MTRRVRGLQPPPATHEVEDLKSVLPELRRYLARVGVRALDHLSKEEHQRLDRHGPPEVPLVAAGRLHQFAALCHPAVPPPSGRR